MHITFPMFRQLQIVNEEEFARVLSPDQKLIYTRARSLGDNHADAMRKALK